ncbi:diguanylate cyclase (GGDEF) domain-containing protein [Williamsia deligens]|nr:diguanylate cyclase (GGDEF) domain-containing protein [Williamsia deligens]
MNPAMTAPPRSAETEFERGVRVDPLTNVDGPMPGPTPKPSFRALLWRWLTGDFDYAYVIEHHSLRPLYNPMRVILAGNTALLAICAMTLLSSEEGPPTRAGVVWTILVFVVQVAVVLLIAAVPRDFLIRHARPCIVGFGIFADLGLASVLLLYSPIVSAYACVFFVVNGALCTFMVSSRWLLAHLAFATAVIAVTVARLHAAGSFDDQAIVAGTIVLVAAVDGIPAVAHFAWSTLSADSRQAIRDPLTGLLNRRGADVSVEPLWSHAAADGHAVAVMVIDVDDFKRINDTFGHDVGDETLRRLAAAFVDAVGDGVCARTGGEEFTAHIAGPPEDLRRRIAAVPARIRAIRDPGCTVSVGAAIVGAAAVREAGIGVVRPALRTADTVMYEAKQRGGDRALTVDVGSV